jgi:4-amino-4-deoxy-L-arabinose transferase-like glycosyltransferase
MGGLVPILILAFGLRMLDLTEHNVWWDEGIGVWLARMPLWESIQWTAGDVHPPLHYMMLYGWRLIAGESVFALRTLSVFVSLLTLPFAYRLGRLLGGTRVGVLAALLLGLSRFSIWWAQEIRMYALAAMLATGSLWAAAWMWRVKRRRRWTAWLCYVGFTTASLYSLYLTATVIAVTNLGFLAFGTQAWRNARAGRESTSDGVATRYAVDVRDRAIQWITAQVAVVAFFLPWVVYALPRMHAWSSDTAFKPMFFLQLYATILAVGSPVNVATYLPLTVVLFVGLALTVMLVWRRVRQPAQLGAMVMILMGLLLPPVVVAVVSLPVLSFYFSRPLVPRYLLPLAACYAVLAAWAAGKLYETATEKERPRSGRIRQGAALLLIGAALSAAIVGLSTFYPGRAQRDDYATIAETLAALRRPEDAVLLYVDRDWPIFTAYYGDSRHDLSYGANYNDADAVAARLVPVWDAVEGVWLVSTPESLQSDPTQQVPAWLQAHAYVAETMVNGEVSLTFYAKTEERAFTRAAVVPGFAVPQAVGTPFGLAGASIPLRRYQTGDTVRLGLYWVLPQPSDAEIMLRGRHGERTYPVHSVLGHLNLVRGMTAIPLTADLPGGEYHISIAVPGFPEQTLGTFTLVEKSIGHEAAPKVPPNPVKVRFGEHIQLLGYALPRTTVAAGEAVALTLYWQADVPLTERYKVFTHVVGETFNAGTGNFLWGQQDNEPVQGQAPTTRWSPGTVIADTYLIPIHAQAPEGLYTLDIGLYGLVDGVRLPVTTVEGETQPYAGAGAVRLATILVTR